MARGDVLTGAALPEEGRLVRGRFLSFDARLGWGRVLGDDRRLYIVRADGLADGRPPTGATVEFAPIDRGRAWEARRVRRIGA